MVLGGSVVVVDGSGGWFRGGSGWFVDDSLVVLGGCRWFRGLSMVVLGGLGLGFLVL